MKRTLLFVLAFVLVPALASTQVRMNIYGGPQLGTADYKIKNSKQETGYKTGFQLGYGLKIPFDNQLYFSPAIFYSLKGYKVDFNRPTFPPDSLAVNNSTSVHSVELAFLLQYDFSPNDNHWFLRLGPTLDFALFGREKFDRSSGSSVSRNMKFGFGDYGHYLASGILQLGYETGKGLLFFGQYNRTLGTIINTDEGPRVQHSLFGLSVGKYLR